MLGIRDRCFRFSETRVILLATAVTPINMSKSSINCPCLRNSALDSAKMVILDK